MNKEKFIDGMEVWFDGKINGDEKAKNDIIKMMYFILVDNNWDDFSGNTEIFVNLLDDIRYKVSEKLDDENGKSFFRELAEKFFERQLDLADDDEEEVFEKFSAGIDDLEDAQPELDIYYDRFKEVVENYFNHCQRFCEKLEERIFEDFCEYYENEFEDFDRDELCDDDFENFDAYTLSIKDAVKDFTGDILNDFETNRYTKECVTAYTRNDEYGKWIRLTDEAKERLGLN